MKDILSVTFAMGDHPIVETLFECPDIGSDHYITVIEVTPDFMVAFHKHMLDTTHPMFIHFGASIHLEECYNTYVDNQGASWQEAHFSPDGKVMLVRIQEVDCDTDIQSIPDDAWVRPISLLKGVLRSMA